MKFQLDRAKQSTKFINHGPIMNCASPRATGECVYFAGFTESKKKKERMFYWRVKMP